MMADELSYVCDNQKPKDTDAESIDDPNDDFDIDFGKPNILKDTYYALRADIIDSKWNELGYTINHLEFFKKTPSGISQARKLMDGANWIGLDYEDKLGEIRKILQLRIDKLSSWTSFFLLRDPKVQAFYTKTIADIDKAIATAATPSNLPKNE